MPTLRPVLLAVLLWALSAPAAALAFDVEYSTAGAMDAPATQGGDVDGWGTDFLARWVNTTGRDVLLEEFGWPCGGWWAQSWFVWIQADLPPGPWGFQHYGSFVPTLEDDTLYPPNLYTYVDVADRGIVVPAGAAMLFGYSNPGMAGQILHNGVDTWSWMDGQWDNDGAYNRTTIMQFRGSFTAPSAVGGIPAAVTLLGARPNPFNPRTAIAFALPRAMDVTVDVVSAAGRRVRRLWSGVLTAGGHDLAWDGADEGGRPVASGVYLVRLATEDGVQTGKMILSK
jgi:hypothetical protein